MGTEKPTLPEKWQDHLRLLSILSEQSVIEGSAPHSHESKRRNCAFATTARIGPRGERNIEEALRMKYSGWSQQRRNEVGSERCSSLASDMVAWVTFRIWRVQMSLHSTCVAYGHHLRKSRESPHNNQLMHNTERTSISCLLTTLVFGNNGRINCKDFTLAGVSSAFFVNDHQSSASKAP